MGLIVFVPFETGVNSVEISAEGNIGVSGSQEFRQKRQGNRERLQSVPPES